MGKILYKCQFGNVHKEANCRCIDNHVEYRQVACDNVLEHSGSQELADADAGDKALKSLRQRLSETVDGFFGQAVMPVVKESLVDALENDVSQWLIEAAKKIERLGPTKIKE